MRLFEVNINVKNLVHCHMLLSLSYYSLFHEMVLKHIKIVDTFIEYTANQVLDFIVVCEEL
jgi:hypothetical protein